MSRGRKAKQKDITSSWEHTISRNIGYYFIKVIVELAKAETKNNEKAKQIVDRIKATNKKKFLKIDDSELQFSIPSNWVWCRLAEISINCDGDRSPISQSEREKRNKIYDYYGASGVIDKIDGYTHDGKYLLIGEDGANLIAKSTPIAFIAEGKFWVNNHAHVLKFPDELSYEYMVYCLNALDINRFISGGFQPKLSQGNLNIIPIPFPPPEEQDKIVDFLQDLEANAIQKSRVYFNANVEQKILDLHNSQLTGYEITTELTHQLSLAKKLRQQLLQDAVQGKLVPQDKNDEPASELMKRIKAEKAKDKKYKELPAIKPEEIPFDIPDNWVWCRLGEICNKITDGFHNTPKKLKEGKVYISATHIREGGIKWDECLYISEIDHLELFKKAFPRKGEILITNRGAGCATPVIIDIDQEFSFQNAAIIGFDQDLLSNKFIFYFILKSRNEIMQTFVNGGLQPMLSNVVLSSIPIPLPQ